MVLNDPSDMPVLFRLQGAPVRLDASFLLVPLYFAFLRIGVTATEWLLAILIGSIIIFLSVLLHEIAHAVVARRHRVNPEVIVVGGFFGYVRLPSIQRSRRADVSILAAGPLANLLLFGILMIGLQLLALSPTPGDARFQFPMTSYAIPWLARIVKTAAYANLGMFVLNMMPAFPLDGGRIYRLLLLRLLNWPTSTRAIAALGVLVGVCSLFAAIKYGPALIIFAIWLMYTNATIVRAPDTADEF